MWKHELTVKDAEMCAWVSKQKSQDSGVSNLAPRGKVPLPCGTALAGVPSAPSCLKLVSLRCTGDETLVTCSSSSMYHFTWAENSSVCLDALLLWHQNGQLFVCFSLSSLLWSVVKPLLVPILKSHQRVLKMEPEIRKVLSSPCCW